jgi:serine protease AprX
MTQIGASAGVNGNADSIRSGDKSEARLLLCGFVSSCESGNVLARLQPFNAKSRGKMVRRVTLAIALLAMCATEAAAAPHAGDWKLDAALRDRAVSRQGTSRVIIQTADGAPIDAVIEAMSGKPGRHLRLLGAQVAEVPDAALNALAAVPRVRTISLDRPVEGVMERTGVTTGATWVRENLGFDGTGVGVAIVDSGAATTHDDLGTDRVVHFADFVDYQVNAYDDYGHGTHVAGIIAGSGFDSNGARRGIAPGASLIVLKVLDGAGNGYISNVIAALDYAVATRATYNIRVINLSVAAGVYQSFNTDPLTLAAKRAVESGLVVITAAGNLGRNSAGNTQYGGITSPGNAPWVLTVGASSHMGTPERADDTIATFSSRGPSYIDYSAKPDVIAPGVGIESLTDASTLLYQTRPAARLWGSVQTATEPYLSMSGTSMAAPVVVGTVALMLQANPALTPNAVKAILQFTAEKRPGLNVLTQGAGFLNARGAVDLAVRFAGDRTGSGTNKAPGAAKISSSSDQSQWSRNIIWGSHRLGGGMIHPDASAWRVDVTWGSPRTPAGAFVVWGTLCGANTGSDCTNLVRRTTCDPNVDPDCENIVWGTTCAADGGPDCENIVWGTGDDENIVWGQECGGQDCTGVVWGAACDSALADCRDVVWPTAACDPATRNCETVVWDTNQCDGAGQRDCETVVWGISSERVGGRTAVNKATRWVQ